MREPAVVWQKVVGWVFGRHPALKGGAVRSHGVLIAQANLWIRKRPALGNQNLALDDVKSCDLFGDGVFHLNAWIDFDEVELAGLGVEQELHGAGVVETDGAADS